MKSMTKFGTSILRTSFCTLTIRSPLSTLVSSGLSPRVLIETIRFSSSIVGIIDLDVEHEAVELRFGQRIGSFLLDRVLRGDDEERIGQLRTSPGRP